MKVFLPFLAIVAIVSVIYAGIKLWDAHFILGIIIPYICFTIAIVGFVVKVLKWALSPVPFNITTVCGQQKSLPFIKYSPVESPASRIGVFFRMFFEIFFFRSLLRNDRIELYGSERSFIYGSERYLWFFALLFHWSMFIIVLKHLRFYLEPIPQWVLFIQDLDSLFQSHIIPFYTSNVLVIASIIYLFLRRLGTRIRYISLPSDYFILFLIGGIIISGILMRHIYRQDLFSVKVFLYGLIYLNPLPFGGFGVMFYVHFCLVCIFIAYLPFSKLMHMVGALLSPTKNMRNDSRARRHINPWNYPVKVHTYEEWEKEFKDALKEADIPTER